MARGRPPPRSVPQGQPTADDVAGPTGRRHDRDPTGGVGEYEEVLKPAVYRTRSSASTRRRREEGGRQCTTLVGGCLWHLPRASVTTELVCRIAWKQLKKQTNLIASILALSNDDPHKSVSDPCIPVPRTPAMEPFMPRPSPSVESVARREHQARNSERESA